jgi:hypothetical protein
MTADEFASELDRVEALLKWWGAPGLGYDNFTLTHLKRFEAIVAELETAATEISARQKQALMQSKDLLVQSLPVFVHSHDLNEVMAAQSKILFSLLETASEQAKTWVNLSNKVRNAQLLLAASTIDTVTAADQPEADTTNHEVSAPVARRRKAAGASSA